MASRQLRVIFQPSGRTVHVLAGTTILEAAARAGLTVDTPCGGAGLCGKCRVQVTAGAPASTDADAQAFSADQLADGWRLACQASVSGDVTVHIPDASLFAQQRILTHSTIGHADELEPAVRKVHVTLEPPTLDHNESDLLRLERALGPLRADLSTLRELPGRLRAGGFAGTAVLTDHHLIDFEVGDTASRCFGVAIDLGTTTLVGSLVDLTSGSEVAITSTMNPQVGFGDDVISRIQHAGTPAGLSQLHESITAALADMIRSLCAAAGVGAAEVYEVAVAGNTTMQHLLCGLDVSALAQVPFVPSVGRGLMFPAAQLHLPIHPRGAVYVFPVIGGFVGGDTVAGILAAGLDAAGGDGPVLMVDIGTNGEIVLAHKGNIWAASTAAGPAFEGARISCGMRATAGAIEKVQVAGGKLVLGVIGDVTPVGLCGSGLIDLAAELLRAGVVESTGRLLPPDELPEGLGQDLAARVVRDDGPDGRHDGAVRFMLSGPAGSGPGGSGSAGSGRGGSGSATAGAGAISLSQRDVRELQLAGGAMRAGIAMLLRQAGLRSADLSRVLLAGGFGSYVRRENAQRMGLLPADVEPVRIQYVGNASLAGARLALRSVGARRRGEQLARSARHVELSQDPNFQMEFAEAMIFP